MTRFIAVNHLPCTGCKTCEVVCSLQHYGECSPEKSAIRVVRREKNGLVFALPLVCQQCEPAPCIKACPSNVLSRRESGGVLVDWDNCSACGFCVDACPAGIMSIDAEKKSAVSCDLCGGQPRCAPFCHAGCLTETDSKADSNDNATHLAKIIEQEGLQDSLPGRRV